MTADNKRVKVMITGGHVTPALAVIEAIRVRHPEWDIVFVGRKYALEGSRTVSEEYHLVTDTGVRFLPLTAGRVNRDIGFRSAVAIAKIPVGLVQAIYLVAREAPSVIVSFGGYVGFPVACAGAVSGIPVVTHEQTAAPGLANRLIARIARSVAVSFPEVKKSLGNTEKTKVTGLPVRTAIFDPPKDVPFPLPKGVPVLAVVGGSTGSVSINTVIYASLPGLLADYAVVHQVGSISLAKAQEIQSALPLELKDRYIPTAYISASGYAWLLHNADIVIGRSGANTVTEAAMTGAVAIWIPLPWASRNEQLHNAELLTKAGSAVVIPQNTLNPDTLMEAIARVTKNMPMMKRAAKTLSATIPSNGADRFVDMIEDAVGPHSS